MSALAIEGLTKRFKGVPALEDIAFDVAEKETLVLFGPSGAGKSVLLRCIAGAEDAESGTISIGGIDMADVAPEHRGIGMAFQNFALFPHMSAFENIASPLHALRAGREQVKAGVDRVAKLLKIDHVLGHAPKALSNGQKQRTALARALAAAPKLLLLDDPLRNVDAKLRFEMRLELPRLLTDQGATVVYVTQDYKEAMALGDRIAVLMGGRIRQLGTPEDIYLRPASVDIAQLFGDPTINLLETVPDRDHAGVFALLSDRRVALHRGLDAAVGHPCVLGVRPESVRFSDAPTAIPVTIEAETPFNEKIVTLVVTKRGREILISRPTGTTGPSSGAAGIEIDAIDAILFERGSGSRIVPTKDDGTAEAAA